MPSFHHLDEPHCTSPAPQHPGCVWVFIVINHVAGTVPRWQHLSSCHKHWMLARPIKVGWPVSGHTASEWWALPSGPAASPDARRVEAQAWHRQLTSSVLVWVEKSQWGFSARCCCGWLWCSCGKPACSLPPHRQAALLPFHPHPPGQQWAQARHLKSRSEERGFCRGGWRQAGRQGTSKLGQGDHAAPAPPGPRLSAAGDPVALFPSKLPPLFSYPFSEALLSSSPKGVSHS